MNLISIETGKAENVAVPDPLEITVPGSVPHSSEVRSINQGDPEYSDALELWALYNGYEVPTVKILAKAFCPTGPGGGIDNSCPPTGDGEAPTAGVKPKVKPKDIIPSGDGGYGGAKGAIIARQHHRGAGRKDEYTKLRDWMDGGSNRSDSNRANRKNEINKALANDLSNNKEAIAAATALHPQGPHPILNPDVYQHDALYRECDNRTRNWASTSADSDDDALRLQYSASKLFNVPMEGFSSRQLELVRDAIEGTMVTPEQHVVPRSAALTMDREYLKAVYDRTQKALKDAGIETVTLYRGVNLSAEELSHIQPGHTRVTNVKMRPLSSFSSKRSMAAQFGGNARLEVTVPRKRILSTARTGFGCWTEDEFVVLGGPTKAQLWRHHG